MNPSSQYQLNEQHRQELLNQAQQERLARQTQAKQQKSTNPLLVSVGRQLVQLGEQLQEQYSAHENLATQN